MIVKPDRAGVRRWQNSTGVPLKYGAWRWFSLEATGGPTQVSHIRWFFRQDYRPPMGAGIMAHVGDDRTRLIGHPSMSLVEGLSQ